MNILLQFKKLELSSLNIYIYIYISNEKNNDYKQINLITIK
jgi:hypothetical protein